MAIEVKKHFRVLEKPVENSDKLLIIYTAMGTKIWAYRWFIASMNKRGYSCIIYDYPMSTVYGSKPTEWEGLYEELVSDAQTRLARYKKQGTKHFFAYGVSMGTLIVNKFARETPEITHVVLNLTYGDVASTLFTWNGVKKAKQALISNGYDLETTRKLVKFADPIHNAALLKGKRVLLYLARKDRVLAWDYTQHTLRAFHEAQIDFEYVENKYLGHFAGGAKKMMDIKRLEQFYSSPLGSQREHLQRF